MVGATPITGLTQASVTDFSAVEYSDMAQGKDQSVYNNVYEVQSANDTSETTYQVNWVKWLGHYEAIPELQTMVDKLSIWTVGKGVKGKDVKKTEKITGFGKDTFNTIMYNQHRTMRICGDSFAEIIGTKRKELRNLKPLNPGSIKIIADGFGIITRYEQYHQGKLVRKFDPEDMFHLSNNRLADQIHGRSTFEKLINTIEAYREANEDLRVVFHRYVKPLMVISVNTDNATEIAAFKTQVDNTMKKSENLIVPKDTVESIERVSVPQYSTLDPLPYIKHKKTVFTASEGMPDVIMGDPGNTAEAAGKIIYLAFQQTVEWEQKYLTEQCKVQLGLELEFEFPASIEPDLVKDQAKDSKMNDKGDGGIGVGGEQMGTKV